MLTETEIFAIARPLVRKIGIYFLIFEQEIVYVGQSSNIDVRLFMHENDGRKEFDSWAWVSCEAARLDEMESLYIQAFRPLLNIEIGGKRPFVPKVSRRVRPRYRPPTENGGDRWEDRELMDRVAGQIEREMRSAKR